MACIRGGGEEGEDWHRAGMLGNKQNVFDDFIAAAEWLEREGWTTRDQLAIDEYVEDGKPIKALRLMFNGRPDDFDRTLDAFDAQVKALRADGEHITTPELVIALWLRVLDHFTAQVGPGAADVPGGSNGS